MESVYVIRLVRESLIEGFPGITEDRIVSMAQAASVCLDERSHTSPTAMGIEGSVTAQGVLMWNSPTDQERRSSADPNEATEEGACAVASVLVAELFNLVVVNRSRTPTGFDYWLGD